MKTSFRIVLTFLVVMIRFSFPAQAQLATTGANPFIASLSTLPDSEMVIFVNTSRILNVAMPRLVPEKELQKLREGMDQIKALTNVDLRNMEFFVVATRFSKPTGGMLYPLPEAMFVARGDFDAKALIGMAVVMTGGVLHEEKFGEHTLYVMKLSDVTKSAGNNQFAAAFSEIAVTTLDASTLAIGNTGYIKSAIEAADGRGRIKSEMVASLVRDPDVLISSTGSPLMAFAKSFGLRMAESRDPNCVTRFGEYYVSMTMGEDVLKIRGAMNADNPETAVMMKNLFTGLLQEGKGSLPDKDAQSMLDQIKLNAEASEVLLETTIPQETAARFIRDMLAPAKAATVAPNKVGAPAADDKKATPPKSTPGRTRSKT